MRPPSELLDFAGLLAQTLEPVRAIPADPLQKRTAIRILSTLTLVLIVSILAVGLVAMMLIRRHRRLLSAAKGRKGKMRPPPDPWFESARRVPDPQGGPKSRVIPLPGLTGDSDDDTVDIDPDELDEGDVEGGDGPPEPPPPPPSPPKPPPAAPPGSRGG